MVARILMPTTTTQAGSAEGIAETLRLHAMYG
jgi:hypothetical protein